MKNTPARQWDFPSAVLLVLLLLVTSQRLYATSWAKGLEIPVLLTLLGSVLGLALGMSRFRPRSVFWFSTGYGGLLIPLLSGWILYKEIPWLERMLSLGGRLGYALYQFFSGLPVPDSVLFIAFTAVCFWIISVSAGYALVRRASLAAGVLPAGITLLVIQLYDSGVGDQAVILAVFAFLGLALLGRLRFVRRQAAWQGRHVWVSAEAGTNLNLAILLTALLLVVLAWLAPASGRPVLAVRVLWEDLTRPWRSAQEDLGNAVAGLQGSDSPQTTGFYTDTLELGLSVEAGDSIYLRVRVPTTARADRYYWRVRTYDQYFEDAWHSVSALDEPITPSQWSIPLAEAQGITGEFGFVSPARQPVPAGHPGPPGLDQPPGGAGIPSRRGKAWSTRCSSAPIRPSWWASNTSCTPGCSTRPSRSCSPRARLTRNGCWRTTCSCPRICRPRSVPWRVS